MVMDMGWMTGYFIEKLTQTDTPFWSEEKCLGYKKTIDCEKCQQVCPTGAISFKRKKVMVDSDRCTGCGYCAQQCPAGTLAFGDDQMQHRIHKARTLSPRVLSCTAHAREGDLTLNCLLGLHKETMVLLGLLTPNAVTYFNLRNCEGCANNKEGIGEGYFWRAWRQASDFLTEAGLRDVLQPFTHTHDSPQATISEVSRRELVAMFRKQTINTAGETGQEFFAGRKKTAYPLRKALIQHLKAHLSKKSVASISGADILGSMAVDKTCNACGDCEHSCPQQAWSLQIVDGDLTLTHQADLCTVCHICQMKCKEKAISKKAVTLEVLHSPAVVKTWGYEHCHRCKRRVISDRLSNRLCPACFKQEKLRNKITLKTKKLK